MASNYKFERGDIYDADFLSKVFYKHKPDSVIKFAAESHVDDSIKNPKKTLKTNVFGTYNLLEASKLLLKKSSDKIKKFRFIHISTDEVYGSLSYNQSSCNEKTQYKPNSPYSASKASSDHLVRAWNITFGVPVTSIT